MTELHPTKKDLTEDQKKVMYAIFRSRTISLVQVPEEEIADMFEGYLDEGDITELVNEANKCLEGYKRFRTNEKLMVIM